MRVWLLTLLLSSLAFAGCTDDGNSTSPGGVGEDGGDDTVVPQERTLVQAVTAQSEIVPIEGSGSAPDNSVCTTGCNFDVYSLTDEMEPDTAYFLEATLTWEMTEESQIDVPYFQLDYESGVRDYDGPERDFQAGTSVMTATLLAKGENEVAILVGARAGERDYELSGTLTPIPDQVPQYAPVAVTAPAGSSILVESQNGAGKVLVFDSTDALVATVDVPAKSGGPAEGTVVLDNITESQEFVFFALDDIWTKVYVLQESNGLVPELRHLPMVVEWYDLGVVNSGGPATFTFNLNTPALQVAYRFGNGGCSVQDCSVIQNADHSLTGPDGTVLLSDTYGSCVCGVFNTMATNLDQGLQAAGIYTIDWDSEESQRVQIHGGSVRYAR